MRADIQNKPRNLRVTNTLERKSPSLDLQCSPFLVSVNNTGRNRPHVRACTYEKEDDEEEGLEVE